MLTVKKDIVREKIDTTFIPIQKELIVSYVS